LNIKTNTGKDNLIPMDQWVNAGDLHGNDELILNHPVMIQAQEEILKQFKPKNSIAFVSLCSATRPYSRSKKWKMFINEFSDVDFIIQSNGGVVPLEYELSYPYLTYDAHGTKEFDELYIIYGMRNLTRFFILKKYRYVLFNFRPTLRNIEIGKFVGSYLLDKGHIEDYVIAPNDEVYREAQSQGFQKLGLSMFPDIHPVVIDDLHNKLNDFRGRSDSQTEKNDNKEEMKIQTALF